MITNFPKKNFRPDFLLRLEKKKGFLHESSCNFLTTIRIVEFRTSSFPCLSCALFFICELNPCRLEGKNAFWLHVPAYLKLVCPR